MELIECIRDKIRVRLYELSKHAVDQTVVRGIRVAEQEKRLKR